MSLDYHNLPEQPPVDELMKVCDEAHHIWVLARTVSAHAETVYYRAMDAWKKENPS